MKTSNDHLAPAIILFWYVPSISQIKSYRDRCELLKKASSQSNPVQVVSADDKTLTFKRIEMESEIFYGLKKIKGGLKKMILNVNSIRSVVLL